MYPELLHIGSWTLRTYSLMLDLGIVLGVLLAYFEARRIGLPLERMIDLVIVAVVGGVVGARLYYVAVNWPEFQNDFWKIIRTWEGGLVLQGAILGALVVSAIYIWRRKLPLFAILDMGMPGAILAQAVGRIGCLFNGCCYGVPTNAPWGISFPLVVDSVPREPTQLFEFFGDLVVLGILWLLRKRKPFDGFIFALYLILYSIVRIVVEFYRGDPADTIGGFRVAQVASFGIMAAGFAVMLFLLWRSLESSRRRESVETPVDS